MFLFSFCTVFAKKHVKKNHSEKICCHIFKINLNSVNYMVRLVTELGSLLEFWMEIIDYECRKT